MTFTAGTVLSAANLNAALAAATPTTFSTTPTGSGWYTTVGPWAVVYFATTANITAGAQQTVYTLPAAVRPDAPVVMAVAGATSLTRPASGVVNTDGTVVVRNNYTSDSPLSGYAVYLL